MMYVDSIPNLILTKKSINWKKISFLNEVVELSRVRVEAFMYFVQ